MPLLPLPFAPTQTLQLSPELASVLPPAGTHIIVSDTLTAPGDVAQFHLLTGALQRGVPVVWLDLRSEGYASWEAIARKLGAPLPPFPRFIHIAPSPLPANPTSELTESTTPPLFTPEPSLAPTFAALSSALSHSPPVAARRPSYIPRDPLGKLPPPPSDDLPAPRVVVLLDGLSELVRLGFSALTVARFVRAALALVRQHGGVLVSGLHGDFLPTSGKEVENLAWSWDGPDKELLARVLRLGGAYWRIAGLSTGRSAEVSGEITACACEPCAPVVPVVGRESALQFRLEPAGVKVFAKGMGRGYV